MFNVYFFCKENTKYSNAQTLCVIKLHFVFYNMFFRTHKMFIFAANYVTKHFQWQFVK